MSGIVVAHQDEVAIGMASKLREGGILQPEGAPRGNRTPEQTSDEKTSGHSVGDHGHCAVFSEDFTRHLLHAHPDVVRRLAVRRPKIMRVLMWWTMLLVPGPQLFKRQTFQVAKRSFAQASVGFDRHARHLSHAIRDLATARKVAGHNQIGPLIDQSHGDPGALPQTESIDRNVGVALSPPGEVPIGLPMSDHEDSHLGLIPATVGLLPVRGHWPCPRAATPNGGGKHELAAQRC